jgi:hypothetical protein
MGCNLSTPSDQAVAEPGDPHFLCPTCATICRGSRRLPHLRFSSEDKLMDIIRAAEVELFVHKSYQDFPWDGPARQNCHLCSIIQSTIENAGYRTYLEETPWAPLTLVLSGHGGQWAFRLKLGQQELPLVHIEIVSPMGESENNAQII